MLCEIKLFRVQNGVHLRTLALGICFGPSVPASDYDANSIDSSESDMMYIDRRASIGSLESGVCNFSDFRIPTRKLLCLCVWGKKHDPPL